MPASFFASWAARDPRATALLPREPAAPDAASAARRAHLRALADARLGRPLPAPLAAVLRRQQAALPPCAARQAALERLCAGEALAVVTGQQMGLFLGPLFTAYKALTAVALARTLERESGVPCVAVFWLQTEDHDFPEIAETWLPPGPAAPGAASAPEGPRRIAVEDVLAARPHGARVSVRHRRFGDDVDAAVAALADALGVAPAAGVGAAAGATPAEAVLRDVAAAYVPGASVAGAFAALAARWLADTGLVLFDAREPEVAALAAPVMRRAFERWEPIADALHTAGAALHTAGFGEQVHVRDDSPLFFFHPEGAEGPRFRLARAAGAADAGWRLVGAAPTGGAAGATGATVSDTELLDALERDPLRFSASALLRPLVQDTLLPTATYVGGPAELAYAAQLAPVYPLFGLAQPPQRPRARVRLVDARIDALLAALGLDAAAVEAPRERVLDALAATRGEHASPDAVRARLLGAFGDAMDAVEASAASVDPGLREPARKTRDSVAQSVERFVERYRRALQTHDGIATHRVERLRAALFPNDAPQERVFGFAAFAARVGVAPLRTRLLEAIAADPFATHVHTVHLDGAPTIGTAAAPAPAPAPAPATPAPEAR